MIENGRTHSRPRVQIRRPRKKIQDLSSFKNKIFVFVAENALEPPQSKEDIIRSNETMAFHNRSRAFLWLLVRGFLFQFAVFYYNNYDCCEALATFNSFEFAKNGVCVRPSRFVAQVGDKQNDKAGSDDDNNNAQFFTMRNVPGQGDCMFLAVALATLSSVGLGGNHELLRAISRETREVVARVLESPGNLLIEGNRLVSTQKLLQSAAAQEGLHPKKYLRLLRKEGAEGGLHGGGPELTVLANVLRRPISIYELVSNDDTFGGANIEDENSLSIECKGVFCKESFRDPAFGIPQSAVLSKKNDLPGAYSWHLHILVVDTSEEAKHACVLLPHDNNK